MQTITTRAMSRKSEVDSLWIAYVEALERAERAGLDIDRARARNAWSRWLAAFLPDAALRSAVPAPRLLN